MSLGKRLDDEAAQLVDIEDLIDKKKGSLKPGKLYRFHMSYTNAQVGLTRPKKGLELLLRLGDGKKGSSASASKSYMGIWLGRASVKLERYPGGRIPPVVWLPLTLPGPSSPTQVKDRIEADEIEVYLVFSPTAGTVSIGTARYRETSFTSIVMVDGKTSKILAVWAH